MSPVPHGGACHLPAPCHKSNLVAEKTVPSILTYVAAGPAGGVECATVNKATWVDVTTVAVPLRTRHHPKWHQHLLDTGRDAELRSDLLALRKRGTQPRRATRLCRPFTLYGQYRIAGMLPRATDEKCQAVYAPAVPSLGRADETHR
ncbi:hypothetical protein TPA0907_56430 [Micromonospora humidisoli]|nr:hypothetical protein TPA0907_56430 [Micromonospora sp. AKA109]